MRLGATISTYYQTEDPDDYVHECKQRGYRAAPCPTVRLHETEKLRAIEKAFANADIRIAEVEAWWNALDPNQERRRRARRLITEGLAIGDEVGAVCCVAVVGSHSTIEDEFIANDAPHPDNFSAATFDAVIEWVRAVLKDANPRRTKLSLEMSPWTILESPEVYHKIIYAVDHSGLAVHLDPSNNIRNAQLYYSSTYLLNYSFDLLGRWIVSCHAKDVRQTPPPYPNVIGFQEVIPGQGIIDYRTFLKRIEGLSTDMPLLIEHLKTPAEYEEAAQYIRGMAQEIGATT